MSEFSQIYNTANQEKKGSQYKYPDFNLESGDEMTGLGESNWVFSYADMMTSMVVFLLLLLAVSQVNYERFSQISEAAQEMSGAQPEQIETGNTPIEKVESQLTQIKQMEDVSFQKEGSGASLIIKDSILFDSGHARLTEKAKQQLKPIFSALQSLPPDYHFIIEGHTDDTPINTFAYASNWELSAARALAVMLWMKELGFFESHLSFHAFGEHYPIVANRNEKGEAIPENQAQNRRAVIKIRQRLDAIAE